MQNAFGEVILHSHFHAQLAASFVTPPVMSGADAATLRCSFEDVLGCRVSMKRHQDSGKNLCHVCKVDVSGVTETSVRMEGGAKIKWLEAKWSKREQM